MTVYDDLFDPLQRIMMHELEVFVKRIGDNKFHGGEWPDLADIAVFASLTCRNNSQFWLTFKEHAFKGRVNEWYWDMKRNCAYKNSEEVVISLKESLVDS